MTTNNKNTINNTFEAFIAGLLARNEVFISEGDLSPSEIQFLEWLETETLLLPETTTHLGGSFWVSRGFGADETFFRTNFHSF